MTNVEKENSVEQSGESKSLNIQGKKKSELTKLMKAHIDMVVGGSQHNSWISHY